ncbi:hypothetical protein BJF85_02810 [Saccharomonospora sp. CUA-673]|nr:hypothetical protein BJF85_02810 [Saccharomonospora sp. CUA-673]
MSDQQLSELRLNPGEPDQLDDGEWVCQHRYSADEASTVTFVQLPTMTNGLADVYATRNDVAVFEPTEVDGYPAVVTGNQGDLRDQGVCSLQVGLSDNYVVTVMARLDPGNDDYPQGCRVAEVVAGAMIENLK